MKKIIAILVVLCTLNSCKLTDGKEENEEVNQETKEGVILADKDENGCLASAGYVWSKVNKECVKVFTGMQLNPVSNPENEDEALSAYILFNEDGDQAELFLPNETSSHVLAKQSNGNLWILGDWQLIKGNGYTLKKADKLMFSGDGQIGKKVMGSDTEQ